MGKAKGRQVRGWKAVMGEVGDCGGGENGDNCTYKLDKEVTIKYFKRKEWYPKVVWVKRQMV